MSITIGGKGQRLQRDFWDSPNIEPDLSRKACHETHPALSVWGGTLLGGNCRDHSRHKNVDLYVALDASMKHPLFDPGAKIPQCAYYPIQNMGIPNNPANFHALIERIIDVLASGGTVHVGCIGGHGRTGLVLAAVVASDDDTLDDPIEWVRTNYCKRAIESKEQEGFLVTHYGCNPPPKRVDKRDTVRYTG